MENSTVRVRFEGLILGFALAVVPALFLWPLSEHLAGWAGFALLALGGIVVSGSSRIAAPWGRSVLLGIGVGTVFLGAGGVAGFVFETINGVSRLR